MAAKGSTLTRKEMKAPDRFQVLTGQAVEWAGKHQGSLVALVAGAAAVVIVALAVTAFSSSRAEKAGGALYEAFDAMDGEISSTPLPGFDRPTFKTQQDKQQAVIAAAEKVQKEYGSSAAARTAALALGDADYELGKWDDAIKAYEQFLSGASKDDSLRFAAYEGVAFSHEQKGELDQAADTFQRLANEVPFYKDRATLERARLLAKAGKVDEAKKILTAFPNDFKDSTLKAAAAERLARLQ